MTLKSVGSALNRAHATVQRADMSTLHAAALAEQLAHDLLRAVRGASLEDILNQLRSQPVHEMLSRETFELKRPDRREVTCRQCGEIRRRESTAAELATE
jgi:hypothetical protein